MMFTMTLLKRKGAIVVLAGIITTLILLMNFGAFAQSPGVNKILSTPSTSILKDYRYENGVSDEEDSVAVWIAPNPDDSLLFITHKKGAKVTVWNLKTKTIIRTLTGFNNPNGVAVDQVDGTVYVTDRYNHLVKKYFANDILNGITSPVLSFGSGFSTSTEPMGVTVYHNNQTSYIYVTYIGSSTKYIRAFKSDGTLCREWKVGSVGLESIKADDENNLIYVADESSNLVKVYTPEGTFLQNFGQGIFGGSNPDPEGIDIYKCNDDGYIIVSDQKAKEFEIFDRKTFQNLAKFKVSVASDTDGIVITQTSLANFTFGGFFAQSRDRYVEGVKWEKIAQATGMTICMNGVLG
jgi:myo-inositol-hexaphosphate 3-phosphohydrolase